jgi:hypothetical protein
MLIQAQRNTPFPEYHNVLTVIVDQRIGRLIFHESWGHHPSTRMCLTPDKPSPLRVTKG